MMGIDFSLPRARSLRTCCHRACAADAPSPPARHRSPFRSSVAPSPLDAFPSGKATTFCPWARRPSVFPQTATAPSPPARLPQHAFPFCFVSALSPPARSRCCFHRHSGREARRTSVRGDTSGGLLPPSGDLRDLVREETKRKSAQRNADVSAPQILFLWVIAVEILSNV